MKSILEALDSNLRKHLLVGAGLGFYWGYTFRPSIAREPSLFVIFGFSILVTVVMFGLRLFQKDRPELGVMMKELPMTFLKSVLIFAALEGRHFVWDIGGRALTTAYSAVMGIVAGALIYWKGDSKSSLI